MLPPSEKQQHQHIPTLRHPQGKPPPATGMASPRGKPGCFGAAACLFTSPVRPRIGKNRFEWEAVAGCLQDVDCGRDYTICSLPFPGARQNNSTPQPPHIKKKGEKKKRKKKARASRAEHLEGSSGCSALPAEGQGGLRAAAREGSECFGGPSGSGPPWRDGP